MLFVGIDLAWSERNGSGVAVLKGDRKRSRLQSAEVLMSDREIVEYIRKEVGKEDAFIAIDAPLIVPNRKGRRVAEAVVGSLFRKYDAGAHPSNRERLSQWSGKIRGEELTKLLKREGFAHSPKIRKFETSRKFFEVYPHPSMVVLFNLQRILRYKNKPNRDYGFRWKEFERYQDLLKGLERANPSLVLPEEITEKNVRKLIGKGLKKYEDLLDAVFSAYIANYAWANPEGCAVLGSMEKGYILTPIFDSMKDSIRQ